MRKLLLIAIVAVSASTAAHADGIRTRGLTLVSATSSEAPVPQAVEQPQLGVADQLKALGEKAPDTQARADAQAPVPAQAEARPETRPETRTASAAAVDATHSTPVAKTAAPAKTKRVAKSPRRKKSITETQLRRELGRFGITW